MGHAAPFLFEDGYRPAPGMTRWLTRTPPILGLAALEAGVDLWSGVATDQVWAKSAALFDIFAAIGDALGLDCVSPRDPRAAGKPYQLPPSSGLCAVPGADRARRDRRFSLIPTYCALA